jgi:hypothetical protein
LSFLSSHCHATRYDATPFFRCNIVRQLAIIGSVRHGALVFAAVVRGLCIRFALVFA